MPKRVATHGPAVLVGLFATAITLGTNCAAFAADENVIVETIEHAFDLTRREPDSVILVGAKPYGPEVGYGWIEVGESAQGQAS